MKFLIDMNLSALWVDWLREGGFEAVHWAQIGSATDPDDVIMEFAREHQYVVLTQDLDFGILLAKTGATFPSVLQLRTKENMPAQLGARVVGAIRQLESRLEQGALVTLDPVRLRARLLPFGEPV